MKKQLDQIAEFNKAFEINENTEPANEQYEGFKRKNLMQEELDEYLCALHTEDTKEIIDAVIDMQYIILGIVRLHGLQSIFENLFDEVHRTNMAKLHNGKIVKNDQNKVIKPKGWQPPELVDIINSAIPDKDKHI